MPGWAAAILATAAVVGALGVLWQKVLVPVFNFAGLVQEMLPLLRELVKVFKDVPKAFEVLNEIVAQVRTDSGSSLLDITRDLKVAAMKNAEAMQASALADEALKVGVETARQLAQMDRDRVDQLMILLDRVIEKTSETGATATRLESGAASVASDLAASKETTEGGD